MQVCMCVNSIRIAACNSLRYLLAKHTHYISSFPIQVVLGLARRHRPSASVQPTMLPQLHRPKEASSSPATSPTRLIKSPRQRQRLNKRAASTSLELGNRPLTLGRVLLRRLVLQRFSSSEC